MTLHKTNILSLVQIAEEAAMKAGEAVMDIYKTGVFETDLKADQSPLTIADKAAHRIITNCLIQTNLPVISEEGNINDYLSKTLPCFWLVDPLDGTKEFIHRNGEFTVNIALIHEYKPVIGIIHLPSFNKTYTGSLEYGAYKLENGRKTTFTPLPFRAPFTDFAERDHIRIVASRSHLTEATRHFIDQFRNITLTVAGSSLKFIMLVENEADIYPRLEPTMEWDTAAGHAILNAVNKGLYNPDLHSELTYNKPQFKNQSFIAF